MPNYRRAFVPGGTFFFTVVTYKRRPLLASEVAAHRLRRAFRTVHAKCPFTIDAIVILPDHLHALWRLPDDDPDFSTRWRLIKRAFSIGVDDIPDAKGRKHVWQERYWERAVRSEEEWAACVDYIHFNPVKHGLVESPRDWPYGSFARAVARGWYEAEWGTRNLPAIVRELRLD